MRNRTAALLSDQPDPALLYRLFFVQQVCLVLVAQVAALALAAQLFLPIAQALPATLTDISTPLALAALFCVFSFFLSEPGRSDWMLQLSRLFAAATALIAAGEFLEPVLHLSSLLHALLKVDQSPLVNNGTALRPATVFALLAVVMFLLRATSPLLSYITDALTSFLCLMTLILTSEYLFGTLRIFGPASSGLTSPPVLACLVLLTAAAVLRRVECGIFSIFLGRGIGSRIARLLAPILLVLPLLREAGRARLLDTHFIPVPYATAILASVATVVSFALLLFLAWRINDMEHEIHDLSLRDELTGLYNLRGFQLLAGQSLRLAHRSQVPFSVLFIDLDELKRINDELGHRAGSSFLAETGKLLSTIFRETDVVGRIGGDEFAAAGQFSDTEIATIAQRLEEACAMRNAEDGHAFPLSFSMGHVTSAATSQESLKDLVSRADKAMYLEKRRKKGRSN